VLSFNRTFNLGAIYVRIAVYKNLGLVRQHSNEHPIFIAPIILHGHSDTMTYSFYFTHIATMLLVCSFLQLAIGSDEELAMHKAMAYACMGALNITCTRLLQSNADKKLDSLINSRSTIRRSIHDAIFGIGGLTSYTDVIVFDDHVEKMRQKRVSQRSTSISIIFRQENTSVIVR